MESISCRLPDFEGPLDLLLTLIRQKKMNIIDVEISVLLDQYMEHINAMQALDLEIASEFLEMASRLVYIKTIALLPRHEEAEELRRELTGQLLEYQECQEMARRLGERFTFDSFVSPPEAIELDPTYRRHHSPDELRSAYLVSLGRGRRMLPPPAAVFAPLVAKKPVSVSSRIMAILRRVWDGGKVQFKSLFEKAESRSDLVATFLAVLELIKGKRLLVAEDGQQNVCVQLIGEGRKKKCKLKSTKQP